LIVAMFDIVSFSFRLMFFEPRIRVCAREEVRFY
jgi:hypothetical protein